MCLRRFKSISYKWIHAIHTIQFGLWSSSNIKTRSEISNRMGIAHKIFWIAFTWKFWFKCAVSATKITTEKRERWPRRVSEKENDNRSTSVLRHPNVYYVVSFTTTKPFKTGHAHSVSMFVLLIDTRGHMTKYYCWQPLCQSVDFVWISSLFMLYIANQPTNQTNNGLSHTHT